MASVVSKITRPATGVPIAFFCVVVITGNRTPCVVEAISKAEADAGVSVPMPIWPELLMIIRAMPEDVPVVNVMAVGTVPAETAPSTNPVMAPRDWFAVPSAPRKFIVPSESFSATAAKDVAVVPPFLIKKMLGPALVVE